MWCVIVYCEAVRSQSINIYSFSFVRLYVPGLFECIQLSSVCTILYNVNLCLNISKRRWNNKQANNNNNNNTECAEHERHIGVVHTKNRSKQFCCNSGVFFSTLPPPSLSWASSCCFLLSVILHSFGFLLLSSFFHLLITLKFIVYYVEVPFMLFACVWTWMERQQQQHKQKNNTHTHMHNQRLKQTSKSEPTTFSKYIFSCDHFFVYGCCLLLPMTIFKWTTNVPNVIVSINRISNML